MFFVKKKKKEFYWRNNYLPTFYMIEIVAFCNEEIYINVFWLQLGNQPIDHRARILMICYQKSFTI